jgi:hypothetical protein
MPGLTPACAHARQSQKRDVLFFPILFTAKVWHPPAATCLALYRMHYVDAILQMTAEVEAGILQ